MRKAVIRTNQLTRNLKLGTHVVHALRGVDLAIYANEMVGIIGPSGSGKSTLLGIIGGLDSPTDGTIEIDGIDITRMSEGQLTDIRNQKIGFVFQFFNLIPTLTALETSRCLSNLPKRLGTSLSIARVSFWICWDWADAFTTVRMS